MQSNHWTILIVISKKYEVTIFFRNILLFTEIPYRKFPCPSKIYPNLIRAFPGRALSQCASQLQQTIWMPRPLPTKWSDLRSWRRKKNPLCLTNWRIGAVKRRKKKGDRAETQGPDRQSKKTWTRIWNRNLLIPLPRMLAISLSLSIKLEDCGSAMLPTPKSTMHFMNSRRKVG